MPFPSFKISVNGSFGSCQREVQVTDPDTGIVTTAMEDCNKKLPDASMFQINNMIKAGVSLDEVNTKILSSGVDTQALTEAVTTVAKSGRKAKSQSSEVKNED